MPNYWAIVEYYMPCVNLEISILIVIILINGQLSTLQNKWIPIVLDFEVMLIILII